MNTKILMIASALFMAALGLAATFLPQELLGEADANDKAVLAVQVAGALYLGFAYLNWAAREFVIGGIYSRPVLMGNVLHFLVAALVFLKVVVWGPSGALLVVVTVIYAVFAAWFGMLMFIHPARRSDDLPSQRS